MSIGPFHILTDVSVDLPEGDVTVILGRNGAGKTTTLQAILGFLPLTSGTVEFDGESLVGLAPYEVSRRGIGYVPERRGMFPTLTVEENLRMVEARGSLSRDTILDMFPILRERLKQPSGALSGGQQQMLAIGRALLQDPKLLVLDEPTKGLAPLAIDELVAALRALKGEISILLVEQNLDAARRLSQHFMVIDDGVTVAEGPASELTSESTVTEKYLTISTHKER
ncbi:ABC transporter ATP-binding protein [Agrococcus sp. ARC_14]|uniref:ABC transporter ATP-binding protein n=1 Tax=Agrococcus sp. ARC_14 TaxID=2919927 RepID=UPI001F057CF1|nr:ABC transporter ATP-binding protein [Agrococcus sp. ARC_14]